MFFNNNNDVAEWVFWRKIASDIDSHRPYRKTDYHALAYNAYNYIAVYLYEI